MLKTTLSIKALNLLPLFIICLPCPAATINVPAEQPTIQAGVDAAQDGDTVLVADGLFTGPGNVNVVISGKSITLRSENGPLATIIDCEEVGRALTVGPVADGSVVIEGLKITNGKPLEADPFPGGGAIICRQATLVIQDCLLTENQVRYYGQALSGLGGAIHIDMNSIVTLLNCSLTENTVSGSSEYATGGAIYCGLSSLTIRDSLLSGNTARDSSYTASYAGGGAIHSDESTVCITDSQISENYCQAYSSYPYSGFASASGGGISASNSTVAIEGSQVVGNRVAAISEVCELMRGAGIHVNGTGSLSLHNCRVTDNYFVDSNHTDPLPALGLNRSGHGGAVYSGVELSTIMNCLFLRNEAEQVLVPYDRLIMDGCTVALGNHEYESLVTAGGIYCHNGMIRNSIVWGNPEAQLYVVDQATVQYCDIEGGWPGIGNIDAIPLLVPGPFGYQYLSQIAAGQQLESPCVNTGDPTSPILEGTTRTDAVLDTNRLDMGYHSDPTSGLFICIHPGDLSFQIVYGSSTPVEAQIEIRPCMGGTIEWEVESNAAWLSLSPVSGESTGEPDLVVVTVDPTGLSPRVYHATITIRADGAENTPTYIPVVLTIGAIRIAHDPWHLLFEEMVNQKPAEDQVLNIWNYGMYTLEWKVSSDAPWLTMNPTAGQSTGELDPVIVHVDSSNITAGHHHATITITDPQAINSPQQTLVTFRLHEILIGHRPSRFTFQCDFSGPPPPEQQLDVYNAGDDLMVFAVTDDAEWLSLKPTGGSSHSEYDIVHIQLIVEPKGLLPGTHEALVEISADMATNSPQIVPVTLTVADSERVPRLVLGPGPSPNNPSLIRVYPLEQDATVINEFVAYGTPGFGARVTCTNCDSDYFQEILTGPGPGDIYGPHVRGFEIDGTPLPGLSFLAYGTNKFGVNVAGGDLDHDGIDEIITGAGPGAVFGPHVRAFDYDGTSGVAPVPGVSFFAYGTPKWGVNVSAGDIDGDGFDEIITGPGPGTVYGPHVRGWNVDGGAAAAIPAVSFFAYNTLKYGVNVTAGDVDGDGMDEIVTGAGPGAVFGPHIRGWNYDGAAVTPLPGCSFFAWQTPPLQYGVNVFAGADLNGNGRDEIVAGRGPHPDADTEVKVFTYDGSSVNQWISLDAYPDLGHGTNVAAGRF